MKKRELLNRPSVLTVLRSIIPVAILPISLACMLLGSHKKEVVGEYKHPLWLQILGWIVAVMAAYLAVKALPNLKNLFV